MESPTATYTITSYGTTATISIRGDTDIHEHIAAIVHLLRIHSFAERTIAVGMEEWLENYTDALKEAKQCD